MSIVKRRVRLLDVNRSSLSAEEIAVYKDQITKQKNNLVCENLTTAQVAMKGAEAMQEDGFRLVEDQIDV